ncbi:MAG: GGDEF domain-containing protein [Paracoccaceae bacterium]|nr:GGDEF domain-containing protein [Paracoccaceae bacterium]
MRFYHLLSQVFPRSFTAKVAFLIFAGMHVPAVALFTFLEATQGPMWEGATVVRMVFLTEIIAMCLTAAAITGVLAPVYRVNRTVSEYTSTRSVDLLPSGYKDEVGRLMTNVNALMLDVGEELDAATRAAETDPLTGLLNRRGFERQVPPEFVGALLYMDIDHFKLINDEWGHGAGDDVLVAVSDALSAALRSRDVLARVGGEEFAVFMDETVEARALDVAERIRDRVRTDVRVHGRPVTLSIGLAIAEMPRPRAEVISAADAAVYDAKAAGRDRVVVARMAQAA